MSLVRSPNPVSGAPAKGVQPIPILLYHSVSSRPAPGIAPFAVSPSVFERHLDLIAASHRVVTISELAEWLAGGAMTSPPGIVVTFDDGFADNLEKAVPLLQARGMRATVYITTGYLDGRAGGEEPPGEMLSWAAPSELEEARFEIGAHGHRHRPLDVLALPEVAVDIGRSKASLESRLGHRVATFAYPQGYRDQAVREVVRASDFDSACGVGNAFSHRLDDRWSIARLTVWADTPLATMATWLRGEEAPLAPCRDALRTVVWRGVRRARRILAEPAGS